MTIQEIFRQRDFLSVLFFKFERIGQGNFAWPLFELLRNNNNRQLGKCPIDQVKEIKINRIQGLLESLY